MLASRKRKDPEPPHASKVNKTRSAYLGSIQEQYLGQLQDPLDG